MSAQDFNGVNERMIAPLVAVYSVCSLLSAVLLLCMTLSSLTLFLLPSLSSLNSVAALFPLSAPFAARLFASVLVFNDRLFVFGGYTP